MEQGIAARVAAVAEPVLLGIGYRLVRVKSFGTRRLHRADHGRAARWRDGSRGLRIGFASALAGARRSGPDRPRLPAGSVLSRDGSSAGATFGFRTLLRSRDQDRVVGAARRAAPVPRLALGHGRQRRAYSPRRRRRRRSERGCAPDRGYERSEARPHGSAHRRIAQARQGTDARSAPTAADGARAGHAGGRPGGETAGCVRRRRTAGRPIISTSVAAQRRNADQNEGE